MALGTAATLAIGSVAGGAISAIGSSKAADAQADAAKKANRTQEYIFERNVQLSEPWRETGANALSALAFEAGVGQRPTFGGEDGEDGAEYQGFRASPGYQFRRDQGEQAIERMASARGLRLSGGTMQDAARFNQGLAADEYGNYWNRLAGLAGAGQTSVQNTQALGQNYANAVGQNTRAAGQARASGYMGAANAFGGTVNSLGGIYGAAKGGQFGANPGFGITPSPAGLQAWGYS